MGLESGTVLQSSNEPAPLEASAPADGRPSESHPMCNFIIPRPQTPNPRPRPVLELVSPDLAPYAGLPLFDLV
jgi:hypothetical protein